MTGRRALVCAASKGLGRGCAEALAREGVDVTICARTAADVERAAAEIGAAAGRPVAWVACDIATAEGRAAALDACPQPDILVNNAGGPPRGDFRDWDRAAWLRAIDANMLAPIELIKATVDTMIERRFGRIVNITSSRRQGADRRSRIVERRALRPDRLRRGTRAQRRASQRHDQQPAAGSVRHRSVCARRSTPARCRPAGRSAEIRNAAMDATPAGRFGDPREFGAICAFLCSVHAGYIAGQNILADGAGYPGTF